MVFKKKKPEIVDTTKEDADVKMSAPINVKDSAELEHLKAMSKAVHDRYGQYFTPDDAANLPDVVWRSEVLVLMAAMLDELRATRQLIDSLNED